MEKHFFYTKNGQNFGPYSIEQLKKEHITPETMVWHADLKDWVAAAEIEELSVLFTKAGDEPAYGAVPPPPPPKEEPNTSWHEQKNHHEPMPPYPPKSYLLGAILTTIFCCMPLGIVSLIYAILVEVRFEAGNYRGAIKASMQARRWMLISVIVAFVCLVLSIIFNTLFFAGDLLTDMFDFI